ncbi:unnamed protein product [Lactuca saligna]|uniref:Pentatricopeptide repeat-containing protein n=1 Tax=Lactuca saligna TaxID=75948 RepID=A0AA35VYS4_LACSI|nr:unnamed protein product [Lactuca saligna]
MLRYKAITGLIKPTSRLGIFKIPISTFSQTTNTQDQTPILQRFQNVSKKDKISVIVSKLVDLENTKEAVYGTLDAWVAEEHEFPIGRVKTALLTLEKKEKWHKVVQVIKWMLSKGHGTTIGTYGQLIRALDMDNRVEEAKRLWGRKLGRNVELVPWKVCEIMVSVYYRNEMWKEVVKLFEELEGYNRKCTDKVIVERVAESYEKLGLVEEKEGVLVKYKSLFSKSRGKYGRKSSKELSKIDLSQ